MLRNLKPIVLLWLVCLGSACSGLIETGARSSAFNSTEYKIRPGDVIEIRFQHYPDFNQTLIVSAQGALTLKMIGALRVTDLTIDIFKEVIVEKYRQLLAAPNLFVSVLQSSNYSVYMNGEIKNPGVLRVRGGLTIREGIMMAGGLKDRSQHYEVIVLRNRGDGVKIHKFEIKQLKRDFMLAPFDVVHVKKSSITQTNPKKNTDPI